MKEKLLLALCAIVLPFSAHTQNVPPSDPSSSQYNTIYLPGQIAAQQNSAEKWADRWGAFSMASDGSWGGVLDMPSKTSAERAALVQCKGDGGKDCKVELSFYNQCGAVASARRGTGMANAPTEDEAIKMASSECERAAAGESCAIFFKGCSLPERIR